MEVYGVLRIQFPPHVLVMELWTKYLTKLLKPHFPPCQMVLVLFVVQSLSHVWRFATPCTAALQASLSFTISQSLLKFMSIESVMPSNHHILCHLLLLLPSIFPSIRVFSNESALHIRWPKYWSFSTSPSNENSGLISFSVDLVWSPCCPRDSSAPQFGTINS